MPDEPTTSGWLPPAAPGGRPAPQFEPAPPDEPKPKPEPEAAAAAAWSTPADRPAFRPAAAEPPNRLAMTSMVLGVIGVLLVLFPLVSLPISIAAWVTGRRSRERAGGAGQGLAQGGVILGIVGVILGAVLLATVIALVAAGVDFEELRRDLEERSSS